MDGARFANAVAFLDCHPGDISWRAGLVLSFGHQERRPGAEAVVFFDTSLVRDFGCGASVPGTLLESATLRRNARIRRERFVETQCTAYQRPGAARGRGRQRRYHRSRQRGVRRSVSSGASGARCRVDFYDWGPPHHGEARLVVSWDQPLEDVDALCAALQRL
jgi:threonine aldolase